MRKDKIQVIAYRLNNMPKLYEMEGKRQFGTMATAFNALTDYVVELRSLMIEIFNEIQEDEALK
jgi:hypothetical protein